MNLFLSGQISGLDYDTVCTRFRNYQEMYRNAGHHVINPTEIAPYAEGKPWIEYMLPCLRVIATEVDRIMMLPGWEYSRGARIEHHFAKELGLEIEYVEEAL